MLLADDQALVRGALAAMLGLEPDIEVVAQVGSGAEVVAAATAHRVDVALLDVQMPGGDGLDAAAALHAALPSCRIVILTTFGRPGYLARAMRAGASGFVVKDAPPEQLVDAVRRVHAGLRVVDPVLAAESLSTAASPLTERERDVLRGRRRRGDGRDGRRPPAPVRGHGAQPPLGGHRQDHRPHPGRGRAAGRRARLAVGPGPPHPRRRRVSLFGTASLDFEHTGAGRLAVPESRDSPCWK